MSDNLALHLRRAAVEVYGVTVAPILAIPAAIACAAVIAVVKIHNCFKTPEYLSPYASPVTTPRLQKNHSFCALGNRSWESLTTVKKCKELIKFFLSGLIPFAGAHLGYYHFSKLHTQDEFVQTMYVEKLKKSDDGMYITGGASASSSGISAHGGYGTF